VVFVKNWWNATRFSWACVFDFRAETQRGFWGCEKLLEGAGGSARAVQWWGLVSIYSKLCAPASLREALFVTSFVRGLRVRFSRRDAEAQSFF